MSTDIKAGTREGGAALGADPLDFAPALLRLQERPAPPLAGWMLRLLIALFVGILLWAILGRLDIVAVADGKLVPQSYLKIVQPPEQGVVRDILVREGEVVQRGQVLIRMDPVAANADVNSLRSDTAHKRLALRRIDAQLAGQPLTQQRDDPADIYGHVEAQYQANVQAYQNALAQERAVLDKARHDLSAAQENRAKLEQVLPHYIEQEKAYDKLARDGYAGRLMFTDKQRERIEKEQDLRAQEFAIRAAQATIAQSEQKISQITSDYRRQLRTEREEIAPQLARASQELTKNAYRQSLLELRAPADGTIKDLATHTVGTVAAPGTILMTLVPKDERLFAEVWIGNDDVGFVRMGQEAKLKFAAFPFQKYGLVGGRVDHVNADATEAPSANTRSDALAGRDRVMGPLSYRTLVELDAQALSVKGKRFALSSGMQVSAEIHLGTRSVLEYVLSPVQRAFHEAGRER